MDYGVHFVLEVCELLLRRAAHCCRWIRASGLLVWLMWEQESSSKASVVEGWFVVDSFNVLMTADVEELKK